MPLLGVFPLADPRLRAYHLFYTRQYRTGARRARALPDAHRRVRRQVLLAVSPVHNGRED